jgi:hypothetical protein
MNCDAARRLISASLDEPLGDRDATALASHTAGCSDCQAFAADLGIVRQRLRVQPVGFVPDVTAAVRARLQEGPAPRRLGSPRIRVMRPALLQAAAVFIAAFLVGALAVGGSAPPPVEAAPLGQRILAAQANVDSLAASVAVTERGWHPAVGMRTYEGTLRYSAPESFAVRLHDRTRYPSADWPRNDVVHVVDDAAAYTQGVRACPQSLQPDCFGDPVTTKITRRPPFDSDVPIPLDLLLPVSSFAGAAPPTSLGVREIDGARSVGLIVTAAQVQPLLDGLTAIGNWRSVHPGDRAEIWLDEEHLVPREVRILPASGLQRRRWAAALGYQDPPGTPVLTIRFTDLRVNAGVGSDDFAVPGPADRRTDAGFVATGAVDLPSPGWLPAGVDEHRSGALDRTALATWSDGRAWLRVAATRQWPGGRLFGDLGDVVRLEQLPGAGVAYVGQAGTRVALHGPHRDVVVSGSFSETTLLRVAGSLGVTGRRVPRGWVEHPVATMGSASQHLDPMLVPRPLEGFRPPAVRVHGDTVVLGYAGAGALSFVLIQQPGSVLAPPLDAQVMGVAVRGRTGRFTPGRGDLEWIEDGHRILLRSMTLALPELLSIAQRLAPVQ